MFDHSAARGLLQEIATARIAADVDALMHHFAHDATFQIIGVGEPAVGIAAIREAVGGLVATFEFVEWKLLELISNGDAIAARHHLVVRHRPSGKVAVTQTADFLSMRDGKCRAFVQFADTALVAALSHSA